MRIRGATACSVSAFTSAWIELVDEPAPAGADGGGSQTASAAATVVRPPRDAFYLAEPDLGEDGSGDLAAYGMPVDELLVEQPDGGMAVPVTIATRPDGTRVVFGHAARWEQCHVGFPGQCVTAPESQAGYSHFHVGEVETADGSRVATGTLTIGTDHAAAELRAPAARDHYANTGLAWADVRATNGAFGVWVSGVVRDDVTDAQLALIRASSLSGDWRRIAGHLEFIAALSVNVPGFPIARETVTAAGTVLASALTASAFVDAGVQMSLTASGIVQRCSECQRRALRAAAAEAQGFALLETTPDPRLDELLAIARRLDARTRPMNAGAAEHALERIRG